MLPPPQHQQQQQRQGTQPGPSLGARSKKRSHQEVDTSSEAQQSFPSTAVTTSLNSPPPDSAAGLSTTNFRLVSACKRCRNRKNKCDQKLPKCGNCLRAGHPCVGFDPIAKRMIPRSYVYYLETRVRNLEALAKQAGVVVPAPEEDFEVSGAVRPGENVPYPVLEDGEEDGDFPEAFKDEIHGREGLLPGSSAIDPALRLKMKGPGRERLDPQDEMDFTLPKSAVAKGKEPASNPKITFAQVMLAARNSVSTPSSGSPGDRKAFSRPASSGKHAVKQEEGTSMREAIFNLHQKSAIEPAPFPDENLGRELASLYFQHANPQIPVIHREEFMAVLNRVYREGLSACSSRELYFLKMIFAIGSGIILDGSKQSKKSNSPNSFDEAKKQDDEPSKKRLKTATEQHQPEEYHASAMEHFDTFLVPSSAENDTMGRLEELQAILLLADFGLLQPVAPGLWYIIGRAMRLAMDLNLHCEDVSLQSEDVIAEWNVDVAHTGLGSNESLGRAQYMRDKRRRLWWCTYAFDRLVSSCVGRPVGIPDELITTAFPSMLDDRYITPGGFKPPSSDGNEPSYKLVGHHYVRLRRLQSEILQVQQFAQAEQARQSWAPGQNSHLDNDLVSPFLRNFNSFREWRLNLDRRLHEWKVSAPRKEQTDVQFKPLFLELNYWQAIILLYRPSLAIPDRLRVAGELSSSTGEDIQSPGRATQEMKEDEDMVFLKLAQAGQRVLEIYLELHRANLVNYTYLATQHLFRSGVAFLSAIWHSPLVRSRTTLDSVRTTIIGGMGVLANLKAKCPPAEACGHAIFRMGALTAAMVQQQTSGFGDRPLLVSQPLTPHEGVPWMAHSYGKDDLSDSKVTQDTSPTDDYSNVSPSFRNPRTSLAPLHRQPSARSQSSMTRSFSGSTVHPDATSPSSRNDVNPWVSSGSGTQDITAWRSNLGTQEPSFQTKVDEKPQQTISELETPSVGYDDTLPVNQSPHGPDPTISPWRVLSSVATHPQPEPHNASTTWNGGPSNWTNTHAAYPPPHLNQQFPDWDLDALMNGDISDPAGLSLDDFFDGTDFNFDGGLVMPTGGPSEGAGFHDGSSLDPAALANGYDFGLETLYFGGNGGW